MTTFSPTASDLARRVLLVGRTGVDSTLRLDSELEIVRCSNLGQAIAELTLAKGDHAGAPANCTLVVARDHYAADASRWRNFVTQARQSYPGVRILLEGTGAGGSDLDGSQTALKPADFAADGFLMGSENADQLRKTVRGESENAAAPTPRAAEPKPTPKPAAPAKQATPPPLPATESSHAGDSELVAALLRGEDALPAAMGIIRDRTGDSTVEFVSTADVNSATMPFSGAQCPVIWTPEALKSNEPVSPTEVVRTPARFGMLRSSRSTVNALAPHANWLATWLRMGEQQSQLREAAFTDPLTKALNRRYFERFMEGALDRARNQRHFVTVLLFDIDNFQQYNDRYGHEAGDEILLQTCELLRSVIRPTDRVCRMGGDEFVVIFDEPEGPRMEGSRHPSNVCDIAERFQKQVSSQKFAKLQELTPGSLTISGGLATFPWDGRTPTELLKKADDLLLQSKRQGKNAITFGPGALRM